MRELSARSGLLREGQDTRMKLGGLYGALVSGS